MKAKDFYAMPLMRRIFFLDRTTGLPYVSEVRRDPDTGLTLALKAPLSEYVADPNRQLAGNRPRVGTTKTEK